MKYQKLVSVDQTGLKPWAQEELKKYAQESIFYETDPTSVAELIERAKDADVLLMSWRTAITQQVIDACPHLHYIGMCYSLYDEKSANIDIAYARSKNIQVRGVRDYGDEGLVEFILYSLIKLYHGFGENQWTEKQEELTGKTLGIIGMGTTGQMLASRAQAFGMSILYFSRTRKPELENDTFKYLPLNALLERADIISTHLPKHSVVIDADAFKHLGNDKILINTSLEPTFDVDAFKEWMKYPHNFAIMDKGALGQYYDTLTPIPNVLYTTKVTGFTAQAEERLSKKVIDNLMSVLKL